MKKTLIFTAILWLGVMLSFSQSITVTKPGTGDAFNVGSMCIITWTKTGSMHAEVKIRLYNTAGTVKILNISNNTSNDGSFPWVIPASLAPGNYLVRVKTIDNGVFGDGKVFEIKGKVQWAHNTEDLLKTAKVPQPDSPLPDFYVEEIFVQHNSGKPFELMAKIKNKGDNFKGKLEFFYTVKGHTTLVTKTCWIGPGKTYLFYSGRNLTGSDLEDDGRTVKTAVEADPYKKVAEAIEWNNKRFKTFTPNFPRPDYVPTRGRYKKINNNKVYSPTGPCSYKGIKYSSYGEYYATIKNIGDSYTGKILVEVRVNGYTGWIRVSYKEFTVTLNKNQEKEFLISKNRWYWCYLKGGKADAKVIITPKGGNTELNTGNNIWRGRINE